ncbi:MAG: helix-turn-helix domain-containing protein [Streptosporangiaceae bacterium]
MTIIDNPCRRHVDDLLAVREILPRAYGGWELMTSVSGTAGLVIEHIDAGHFSSSDGSLPGDLSFKVNGRGAVSIATVTQGTVWADRGPVTECYQPGEVFVASFPQADFVCRTRDARIHALTMPAPLLAQAAGAALDGHGWPLRFLSLRPASPARRDQWNVTAAFAGDLLANPEAAQSSHVITSAARLLAATVLAVFPNTALSGPAAADRHSAGPAALRRAISFIDDHAQADITAADIAAAGHVTTRAIQFAFRRHLDTTPTAYLRQVRLTRAHADLMAADPGDGQTVTAVAARWGFPSASRFTACYREVYGVPPSHTLRQRQLPAAPRLDEIGSG